MALTVVPEGGDGPPQRGRRPTVVEVRTWVRGTGCGIYPARWMTKDDEVIWEQGARTAVRKSDDCCRQSATHPLRAGVSDPKSKGGGEARRTLNRGRTITRLYRERRRYAWGGCQVSPDDGSVPIEIITTDA